MYTWNPVFNFVMDIKNRYLDKCKSISYDKKIINGVIKTCLELWIIEINDPIYIAMASNLQINQNGNLVLVRYGRYSDVFNGEQDVTNDNFWDMYDGFYKECRSVVIDVVNNVIVLSPFKKFRNLNESPENSFENIVQRINIAKSIEISNKLDGSMQSARWYHGEVVMSGSQSINQEESWRLKDGYEMLISNQNYIKMLIDNQNYTFIFEYISLKDAHIVNYKKEEEGLYLIGIRDVNTGEQKSYNYVISIAKKYEILSTSVFNKNIEEVMEDVKLYTSDKMEGYVLNIDGYFVKVKCDDYTKIHKVLSKISSINLIIMSIANDCFDDLISKIPEVYKDRVLKVANIVLKYIKNTSEVVNKYFNEAPKDDVKSFMIWVDKNVPREYNSYVKNIYLGRLNNFIKSGNELSPMYKKLKDMGVSENYSEIFSLE